VISGRPVCSTSGARQLRIPHLGVAGLVAVLLLSVLAASVPGSNAALVAQVTNSANTVSTQAYFTCSAAITASAPRVYYKLDEATGATTAADSSGQARSGTYQGTSTKGAADACSRDPGTSVAFDGSSGYLNLGTSLSVAPTYSCEAWFKTTTTTGGLIAGFGALATGASTTVDRVLYMSNAGAVVFGNNNASKSTISAAGPYNDNQWHHVLATVGTGGMRLYLDGKQVATSSTTATASYTGFFRVGFDNLTGWTSAPTSSYFRGTLDEVAAYSTTLTGSDAINHYQAGV
jgi:Concanavalin A-like lectin/glucanases superfamily